MRFPCPCCGYVTLPEEPPGTFLVCPVCAWEDDNLQYVDPDLDQGANDVSLSVARRNFADFGAASRNLVTMTRDPLPDELPSAGGGVQRHS